MRKRFAVLVPVLLALLVSLLAGSASAGGSSFVSWANGERAAAGRPAYASRGDLAEAALRHARRMAASRSIYHNPNLRTEVAGWAYVGENVGVGDDERVVHEAFLRSPAHRANILDSDFTEIGVGVVTGGDGKVYVVQVFRRPASAASATGAAARPRVVRPAARPAPRPVAKPRPAPTAAQLLAARPAPPAGALPRAVAYTDLLAALATATR